MDSGNGARVADCGEMVSPAQFLHTQRELSRRIIDALKAARIEQYIQNGHIEIIICKCAIKPTVRFDVSE